MILMAETRLRSIVKSAVYRVVGILVLGYISWIFTGSWMQTTGITASFNFIQVILYYFHERVWDHVNWGEN
ncbi:MAG: DUF2061 domain-containing protein [Candidatus Aenigmarchaeota archaeon]|nr:DUF2061 domain-containing protein [Candidatus Aenigmarchaeota archaeon]